MGIPPRFYLFYTTYIYTWKIWYISSYFKSLSSYGLFSVTFLKDAESLSPRHWLYCNPLKSMEHPNILTAPTCSMAIALPLCLTYMRAYSATTNILQRFFLLPRYTAFADLESASESTHLPVSTAMQVIKPWWLACHRICHVTSSDAHSDPHTFLDLFGNLQHSWIFLNVFCSFSLSFALVNSYTRKSVQVAINAIY